MAKKRKGQRYKRRKAKKVAPKDYEGYQYGPLKLERFGRFVRLSSEWGPGEFEKHIETVKANREPFRQEITGKIQELLEVINQFDPFELLSTVALRNVFANPETFTESTHEGKESYVEYALSLALSIQSPKVGKHATSEAIERFNSLIEEIFNSLPWFFGIDVLDEKDETKQEIRFQSLLRYLMLRGDSYPEHHIDLVKGLFRPHAKFFSDNYGFSVDDVVLWVEQIEAQIVDAFHREGHFAAKLFETHELFKQFVKARGENSFVSLEECVKAFDSLPEVQIKKKELEALHEKLNYFIFEVRPGEGLPQRFLDLVSAEFGSNEPFTTFEKSPGWPTNDSLIYRRPLISHNGKYYCFASQILYRNLVTILESLIKEKDSYYLEHTYQKTRGRYLVSKALEYLKALLPGAKVYEELYYQIDKNGQTGRAETDGIILFDTNLLIVEGKAGSLTTPARRGALSRIKRSVVDLVDSAYEQALRTKQFIAESEKPRFEYENGSEALVIHNKQFFKNVYLINVTLENLAHLSTHLNSLKNLNLISSKEWPWSVFLNDLRVISETLETPSEFLVFLQRRLRANDYPQFRTSDELDLLMYYLYEGLYFEDDKLKGLGGFTPTAITEDLDRYYSFKAGMVSSGEKPRLRIPEAYKTLIKNIEATSKHGFSEVTTILLSFDSKPMLDILTSIEHAKQLLSSDGKDHDFTLPFSASGVGLTISTSVNRKGESLKKISDYCALKMYQLKLSRWVLLLIDSKDGEEKYDFRVFNKEWSYDPHMEEALSIFRKRKLEQFFASGNKIGRNDPCPCNSGLKYKKCCGM